MSTSRVGILFFVTVRRELPGRLETIRIIVVKVVRLFDIIRITVHIVRIQIERRARYGRRRRGQVIFMFTAIAIVIQRQFFNAIFKVIRRRELMRHV